MHDNMGQKKDTSQMAYFILFFSALQFAELGTLIRRLNMNPYSFDVKCKMIIRIKHIKMSSI